MPRVALIASHVIQYQDPFFRLLAREPDFDLTVIFCSRAGAEVYRDPEMQTTLRWDLEMLQGYEHKFLRNFGRGEGYARLINPGIVPELLFGRYDAAIFFLGWGTISSLLGIAACRMRGLPFFLFGDSSFWPKRDGVLRGAFLRTLFRLAHGFLVSGEWNARFYEHYGAEPQRFFRVPWAIDNERFFAASALTAEERGELRARYEIAPEQMAVVFSGKLLPRKDPLALLRAAAQSRHRARMKILFLGHGELRDEAERFAREHDVDAHFAGFVNQTDLPKLYAMSDVFVLPSWDDPRATVVNEAMACGLPVIITDRCGPAGDIARHGDNAFVFAPGDVTALAQHLDTLAADPELRRRMGARSRAIIEPWSYETGVAGVKEALRSL
jgi:glycosyltransferase involved in cell wall biosynthesis